MIAGLITAVIAAVALYLTGAPALLGAHPQWATSVISIGAPIGIFGFMALVKTNKTAVMVGSVTLLIVAYVTATVGKSRFGASYGDDALAGQMWHYGWIAICAMFPLALAAIVQWVLSRRR